MIKICFVTPELSPFTPGGIGVLIRNLIDEYIDRDVEFHILATEEWTVDYASFSTHLPLVRYWRISDFPLPEDPFRIPPASAFATTHPAHHRSYHAAQALKSLAADGICFDVVEFPDWGGLGYCSCQEKLLGALTNTKIAVRLHSTASILRASEPEASGSTAAILTDLERKALRDADIVIAHLQSVADATCAHFGLGAKWSPKLVVNLPPVRTRVATATATLADDTPLCFPSKIQEIKRPETFLKGAMAFLMETPDYRGDVVFMAQPTDPDLLDRLVASVPSILRDRVIFKHSAAREEREAMLSSAVSVYPAPFESFCLAAHEASALGGLPVLNENNCAFSEQTHWKDGVNCIKFDGTAIGLHRRLKTLWRQRSETSISPVEIEAARAPYWERLAPLKRVHDHTQQSSRLISVVIPYRDMGKYIERTIQSVTTAQYAATEIIIVNDASTDAHSLQVLEDLQAHATGVDLAVIHLPVNMGLSAARNVGIGAAKGDYVLIIDADDLVRPEFLSVAVAALEHNGDFDVVVPQTALVTDDSTITDINVIGYMLFAGEALASGSFINRFATATCLARKSALVDFPYDEHLTSYEDWDFYTRLVYSGLRLIVTSDIYFYYRRRPGSMISGNTVRKHHRNLLMLRSKHSCTIGAATLSMATLTDAEDTLRVDLGRPLRGGTTLPSTYTGHDKDPEPSLFRRIWQRAQMRRAVRALRSTSFDPEWYLERYPDVAAANVDPAKHFLSHGQREGRLPNRMGQL